MVLSSVLLAVIGSIPSNNADRSVLRCAILGAPPPSAMHGRPLKARVYRTTDGLDMAWWWEESPLPSDAVDIPGVDVYVDLRRRTGLLHLTVESQAIRFLDNTLTPAEKDSFIDLVRARLPEAAAQMGEWSHHARALRVLNHPDVVHSNGYWTTFTVSRPRRAAIAANAMSSLLALAWVVSLAINAWKAPSYARAIRAQRRVERGLCPACGYNRIGSRESPCPECGTYP